MTSSNQPRIAPLDPNETDGPTRSLLDATKKKFGSYLNFFSTLAKAPAVLEGYTGLSSALGQGTLDPKIREEIAVAISSRNECGYCLTAHGHAAGANGIEADELTTLLKGQVNDPREQAAVDFAIRVFDDQGRITNDDLTAVKAAGFSEGEILEMVAHVSMTVFSNALNNVSQPDIDLPGLPIALPAVS